MKDMFALKLYTRVARLGSFSAAARECGLSQPQASRIIADLEAELGARLLTRTTRAVAPTEAGTEFLARVEPILLALDEAENNALQGGPAVRSGTPPSPETSMTNATHETAPTVFVQVGDRRFAYRRFGPRGGVPLLLLNYFAATLDDWDPEVTNGLAREREVILFDNAGVGSSTGETPPTVAAMTKDLVGFCRALGLKQFDVLGFSLGGMIAQQLAHGHPDMIRRMILSGTGPRGGEGMTFTELSPEELDDPVALLMGAFFTPSEASQAAGRAYVERLKLRVADRDAAISKASAGAQLEAIREWGAVPPADRYAMLDGIRQPALVVHGMKDAVVMPINAFILAQHLPDAQLVMYPDASHGAQSQHAKVFLEHARLFLNG